MINLVKRQKNFECTPYSFFIRNHKYNRKTQFHETEVVSKNRSGNSITLSYDKNSSMLNFGDGLKKLTTGTSAILRVSGNGSGLTQDLDKYMDIKMTITVKFGNSKGEPQGKPVKFSIYYSSYSEDENDNSLFFGYDYAKLDEVPIRTDNYAKQWRNFLSNYKEGTINSSSSFIFLKLTGSELQKLAKDNGLTRYNTFKIQSINFDFYQRRLFYKIDEGDTDGESTAFGKPETRQWYDDSADDSHPKLTVQAKNEVIKYNIKVKTQELTMVYDYYSAYYTTDKAVFPLASIRQLTTDTAYRKPKVAWNRYEIYPDDEDSINIYLSDDTNPDVEGLETKGLIQTFTFKVNDNGLPYIIDEIGNKDQIEEISSTATPEIIGDENTNGCADTFVFEKYYFDKQNIRNNKVVKITVVGKNKYEDDGLLDIIVVARVVKNTTLYELYQKSSS